VSPRFGQFSYPLCLLEHDTCHPLTHAVCQLLVRARLANMVGDVSRTLRVWINLGVRKMWGVVQCRNIQRKTLNVDHRIAKDMWRDFKIFGHNMEKRGCS
jgi:hypothetical protein